MYIIMLASTVMGWRFCRRCAESKTRPGSLENAWVLASRLFQSLGSADTMVMVIDLINRLRRPPVGPNQIYTERVTGNHCLKKKNPLRAAFCIWVVEYCDCMRAQFPFTSDLDSHPVSYSSNQLAICSLILFTCCEQSIHDSNTFLWIMAQHADESCNRQPGRWSGPSMET